MFENVSCLVRWFLSNKADKWQVADIHFAMKDYVQKKEPQTQDILWPKMGKSK